MASNFLTGKSCKEKAESDEIEGKKQSCCTSRCLIKKSVVDEKIVRLYAKEQETRLDVKGINKDKGLLSYIMTKNICS